MNVGTGSDGIVNEPSRVFGLEEKEVIKVVCGSSSTYVITKEGMIYSWGSGRHGMLGHGECEDYEYPSMISSLLGKKIVGIASGGLHVCAWAQDGRVYSWGYGKRLFHFLIEQFSKLTIAATQTMHWDIQPKIM